MFPDCGRREFVRLSLGGGLSLLGQQGKTVSRPKACILLWLQGAPSQVDTFDLKPGLTPFREIETAAPEIRISEGFPRLARQMKSVSLIRSLHSKDPNHATATSLLHTGWRKTPGVEFPHAGSVVVHERGEREDLPGTIVLGIDPQCGAGFLPGVTAPLVFDRLEAPGEDVKASVSRERLDKRWKLLSALDTNFAKDRTEPLVAERRRAYERAYKVLTSEQVKAFDLSRENTGRYGDTPFGRGCLLARRLVEAGARFVEVALGDWDSHAANEERHRSLMGTLDAGFAALMADLIEKRLLDDTIVLCVGEFGRTPAVNAAQGRDHWTKCFSAAIAGGGIVGGRVVGETDGHEVVRRPVGVPDLFATLFTLFGIDPSKEHTRAGRPLAWTEGGKLIDELL